MSISMTERRHFLCKQIFVIVFLLKKKLATFCHKIEISVTKHGYVGKLTLIKIVKN